MSPIEPLSPRQIDHLLTLDRARTAVELLRGLAHALRNHLQVIALGSSLPGGSSDDRIERAIDDMSDLLQLLGQLGRHPDQDLALAPLGPTLGMVEELSELQRNAPALRVVVIKPDESPAVAIPQPALLQVLLNLVFNAKEATGPGGEPVLLTASAEPPGTVEIAIEDRGAGPEAIDPAPLSGSRAPTTHGGTGVFASRALLERHGGALRFEPRDGGGTRTVATLPAVTPRPA
ncbi:MAG: sensor histidine kinase [Gemmatimonadales bacterium]